MCKFVYFYNFFCLKCLKLEWRRDLCGFRSRSVIGVYTESFGGGGGLIFVYLRIFESEIVRKIYYGSVKGERWGVRTNKKIRDTLQGEEI